MANNGSYSKMLACNLQVHHDVLWNKTYNYNSDNLSQCKTVVSMQDILCFFVYSNKYHALMRYGILHVLSNKSLLWDSRWMATFDCWNVLLSKWISMKNMTGGNHPVLTPCEVSSQHVSSFDWQSDHRRVSCHFNSFSERRYSSALHCLLRSCMFDFGAQKSNTADKNTSIDGLTELQKLNQK